MPITNAELSSISAAPVTNNAVEPLRSAELTMPVAMRLPTPYAKKPARKRTPTIRAVRRTLESGRTTGVEVEWLEAGFGSTREMSMGVTQSANATFCVGSGGCPGAASGAMTTTTSHATPHFGCWPAAILLSSRGAHPESPPWERSRTHAMPQSARWCRSLDRWGIRLRRWGVVDSNMVVEHGSARKPFALRDGATRVTEPASFRPR